jgi:hypothetical protein
MRQLPIIQQTFFFTTFFWPIYTSQVLSEKLHSSAIPEKTKNFLTYINLARNQSIDDMNEYA